MVRRLRQMCLGLVLLGCGSSTGPAPGERVELEFEIHGVVRSAADQSPIAGASLRLRHNPLGSAPRGVTVDSTTTDATGQYELRGSVIQGCVGHGFEHAESVTVILVAENHFGAIGFVRCTEERQRIDFEPGIDPN